MSEPRKPRPTQAVTNVSGDELLNTRFHVQHTDSASFDVPSTSPNVTYLQIADPAQLEAIASRLQYLAFCWRTDLENLKP